jgi:2-oxo-3-hexenedioate decarboxylase
MTPHAVLQAYDEAVLWPRERSAAIEADVAAAYQEALKVRALRIGRGERPRGYEIGFTNRPFAASGDTSGLEIMLDFIVFR